MPDLRLVGREGLYAERPGRLGVTLPPAVIRAYESDGRLVVLEPVDYLDSVDPGRFAPLSDEAGPPRHVDYHELASLILKHGCPKDRLQVYRSMLVERLEGLPQGSEFSQELSRLGQVDTLLLIEEGVGMAPPGEMDPEVKGALTGTMQGNDDLNRRYIRRA